MNVIFKNGILNKMDNINDLSHITDIDITFEINEIEEKAKCDFYSEKNLVQI